MSGLRISPDLELPLEAVTETFAILAVSGAGKSNAAVVFAEELYDHDLPWVAIDPKGDWWGVRSSADGKGPGLSVVVFGGEHADVPLEPTAGRYIADLIVDKRLTCVLDISEMTKADMRRFLTDFAERLYRLNREPLMVFYEEADEYIPQMVRGESAKVVGAMETLFKKGRFRGLGGCLVSQRSASVNKDVLSQVRNLIGLQTPSPQDRKAILGWVDHHASARDVVDRLPSLQPGEAWFFSPAWLRTLVQIRFRQRRTFDSGATPKIGQKPRPPARLADVDLAAIKEAMADTIEKAKAADPVELRKRIRELETQLARASAQAKEVRVPVEVHVPTPVLTDEHARLLVDMAKKLSDLHGTIAPALQMLPAEAKVGGAAGPRLPRPSAPAVPALHARVGNPSARGAGTSNREERPAGPTPVRPAAHSTSYDGEPLGKAHKAVLTVLSRFPDGKTRKALAALAGLKASGGHFGNVLSWLRTRELITGEGQGPYIITTLGLEVLGDDYTPLPQGHALLEWWFNQLGKAHQAVLATLVARWPDTIDRNELAALVGIDAGGGHYGNVLSALRTRDLITGKSELRADDEFMEAINA